MGLDRINREIDRFASRKMATAAEIAFRDIIEAWPKLTFWSAANHRVAFGEGPHDFPVEPATRPENPGALRSATATNTAQQMVKIKSRADDPTLEAIEIGNAVYYARNVGHTPGQGALIYQEAAEKAARIIERR